MLDLVVFQTIQTIDFILWPRVLFFLLKSLWPYCRHYSDQKQLHWVQACLALRNVRGLILRDSQGVLPDVVRYSFIVRYIPLQYSRQGRGPSIKDVGIFLAVFDTPLPHVGILTLIYLLLPSNILQHRNLRPPSALKYSDVFYGWPLG